MKEVEFLMLNKFNLIRGLLGALLIYILCSGPYSWLSRENPGSLFFRFWITDVCTLVLVSYLLIKYVQPEKKEENIPRILDSLWITGTIALLVGGFVNFWVSEYWSLIVITVLAFPVYYMASKEFAEKILIKEVQSKSPA